MRCRGGVWWHRAPQRGVGVVPPVVEGEVGGVVRLAKVEVGALRKGGG